MENGRKRLRLGDRVERPISCIAEKKNGIIRPIKSRGKIVYIHPKGRYYVVEFDMPRGKIRESYHTRRARA